MIIKAKKLKSEKVKRLKSSFAFLLLPFALFLSACQTSENKEVANTSPSPTATVKQNTLQDDLKFIENANFQYVYVFRRKDGEKFDSSDVGYLKDNANPLTNQWLKSEEGKTVIAGSNFKFDKKMLDALKKRFAVKDLSPKVEETEQNPNVNR
jgi:hypothetical protein